MAVGRCSKRWRNQLPSVATVSRVSAVRLRKSRFVCPLTLATLGRDGLAPGAELVQGIFREEECRAHDGQFGGAGREIPGNDAVLTVALTAISVFIPTEQTQDSRVEVIARE